VVAVGEAPAVALPHARTGQRALSYRWARQYRKSRDTHRRGPTAHPRRGRM